MILSPALDAVLLLVRTTAAAIAALDPALSRVGLWLTDLSLLRFGMPDPAASRASAWLRPSASRSPRHCAG